MDSELLALEANARRTGATLIDRLEALCATYQPTEQQLRIAERYLIFLRSARRKVLHKMLDGTKIKVIDMTDAHLKNTAALFFRDEILYPEKHTVKSVCNIEGRRKDCNTTVRPYTDELFARGFRTLKVVHRKGYEEVTWVDIHFAQTKIRK